jgi:hypothetical protein
MATLIVALPAFLSFPQVGRQVIRDPGFFVHDGLMRKRHPPLGIQTPNHQANHSGIDQSLGTTYPIRIRHNSRPTSIRKRERRFTAMN